MSRDGKQNGRRGGGEEGWESTFDKDRVQFGKMRKLCRWLGGWLHHHLNALNALKVVKIAKRKKRKRKKERIGGGC